jgi:hypothetical protein
MKQVMAGAKKRRTRTARTLPSRRRDDDFVNAQLTGRKEGFDEFLAELGRRNKRGDHRRTRAAGRAVLRARADGRATEQ